MDEKKGLVIVYTGNCKGKTTAALGLSLRAIGYGLKICMIQFIMQVFSWHYGELDSIGRLRQNLNLLLQEKDM